MKYKLRPRKTFKNSLILALAIGISIVGGLFMWMSTFTIPTLDNFEERKVAQSTKIYDRTGEILLYDVYRDIKRTVVPFDQISSHIKETTIAIEDTEFYKHGGVRPLSIIRAVLVNLGALKFNQGGSTITQQVVKNSLLTGDKKISRKLKEWALAVKLERALSKDQILSMYLNEIPYGGSLYGVEEASNAFFGKKSSDVTLAEAAYLAALPKAPTFYSPYNSNRDQLEERKNLVLEEMLSNGFITEDEYGKALKEKVAFKPQADVGIKAPHFVMFVKKILEEKYGQSVLEDRGLKVTTTLDYGLQKKAEELALKFALENEKNYNAENLGLTAINPKTGDILTMVGSRNYFDDKIDGNFNIATAERQPGSAFKPFAYATAFKKGFTPETVLFDVPTEFSSRCSPQGAPLQDGANCYMPQNYDNNFRGPITMRQALAQSINIPSVKTLYLAGMKDTLRLAKDMGIESLTNAERYGLTLVLGGGEVSLLDMTSAYSVFANNGERNPYTPILEIKDRDGTILEKFESRTKRVIDEEIVLKISNILSDSLARAPVFGRIPWMDFGTRQVALKTGTTNNYRDAWVVGYTPSITVGAWVGNNDNTPMDKKVAGYIVTPFWRAFMDEILSKLPNENFNAPEVPSGYDLKPILRGKWQGDRSYLIDRISNRLATEFTPPETIEEITVGEIHSILNWLDKDNPRGPKPTDPNADPQFHLWEYSVQQWIASQGIREQNESVVPTEYDNIHTAQNRPVVSFINPQSSNVYNKNQSINVSLQISSAYPITKINYYVNNNYIGNSNQLPFTFSFIAGDLDFIQESNTLKVAVEDTVFNRSEQQINFQVSD